MLTSRPDAWDRPAAWSGIVEAKRQNGTRYNVRQVFVPREAETAQGTVVFRTTDKLIYARLDDGSIRRAIPKVRGKSARRADKKLRQR